MADSDVQVIVGAQIAEALEGINRVGEAFKSLAEIVGVGFSLDAIKGFVESMAELGLTTERSMATLGESAQKVVELSGVAKLTGTSMDSLSLGILRASTNIQKSAKDAFSPASQALKSLGLSAQELSGLGTDQFITRLADAVSKFNPSMQLTDTLMMLGVRGIQNLMPMLEKGSAGFQEMKEAIDKASDGLAQAVPGMAETHEKLTLMGLSVQSLGARIFSVMKPAIDSAVKGITEFIQGLDTEKIQSFARAAIDTLGNAIVQLIVLFESFGNTLDDVLGKLKTLLAGAAIGGAIGVIGGPGGVLGGALVGGGLAAAWSMFQGQFNAGADKAKEDSAKKTDELIASIKSKMAAVKDAMSGGFDGIMTGPQQAKADIPAPNLAGKDQDAAYRKSLDDSLKLEDLHIKSLSERYSADVKNFTMTEAEKVVALTSAIKSQKALDDQVINQELADGNLTLEQRRALLDKKVQMEAAADQQIQKLNEELYKQERTEVAGYVNNVQGSWNSSLRGMLAGTTSFGQATMKVFSDLILYIIEKLEEKLIFEKAANAITQALYGEEVATKVAGEATKTAATEASVTARIGAELTAAAANIATYISDAMAYIGAQIAKVFAGLSAFFAGMGPVGIAAAAGLAAGVGAAAVGMIKKFDVGTDYITRSGLAVVHQGEAIVPAASNGAFTGGAGGGASHPTNITITNNGGMTAAMTQQQARQIAAAVADVWRFAPSLRPAY